jgi:predicted CoA-binding protein
MSRLLVERLGRDALCAARGEAPFIVTMKHMTRDDVLIQQLLTHARTVAIIGASPRADRHSGEICRYLHEQGFEVMPVRPDRADVAGLKSYERLADVPGPVDLVVIFRNAEAAPQHIAETVVKSPEAVWLPPGVWSRACEEEAARIGVTLVFGTCIEEAHRRGEREPGHPSARKGRFKEREPQLLRGRHAGR